MVEDAVYIVDGTSLCYRSFFAIKLSTSAGFPTGAVYGVYQTLKKIISKYKPRYMGICFDVSRKTFRRDILEDYKIQRPPLPDGLKVQIPVVKKLINLLGITLIEKEDFEADDVIACLTKKALCRRRPVVIVSSDKDLCQLIDDNRVVIYNLREDRILNEDDFVKIYGFSPPLIVDYLSLAGDSVDNIPGAKGIGKVGASRLIRDFGTIENIFDNLKKLPSRTKELLSNNRESVFLSKKLVKLNSPDLDVGGQDLKLKKAQSEEIYKLFQELEFRKLLKDISPPSLELKIKVKDEVPEKFWHKRREELIFFTERDTCYIFDQEEECVYKTAPKSIKPILDDENIKKISYDFKSQLPSFPGKEAKGMWFDVKVAAYLLDPSFVDYRLSTLGSSYLGHLLTDISYPLYPYFIYQLYEKFSGKLKEEGLYSLFSEVEMPLVYVLYKMQEWGIKIDRKILENLSGRVERKINQLSRDIFGMAGKDFNLNSPQQLSAVLFQDLKIPPLKKIKTGYSTGEDVLEKLSSQYPIARLLLEHRQLNKLKTTYILPLIQQVGAEGGRLHATFNQTSAQTGRISCSSPNLQSIPMKGEFAAYLRRAFIPSFPQGYILSCDYSQIELRLLAHFSGDRSLVETFGKDLDIHRHTAALLLGIDEKDVGEEQRGLAKRVNFGILYGMSSYGLARELNVTAEEAAAFIENYFLRYSAVRDYIEETCQQAGERGLVKTLLGRRRYLPGFKSSNPQMREFARRQTVNTPIQGSCADIIKLAMVRIFSEFKERGLKAKLIIQIHDELIFDVPNLELKEVADIARRHMEGSVELTVPIKVNIKAGRNWAKMQEII